MHRECTGGAEVADFTVLRAKAKANLLGAYRSGELEQAPSASKFPS